MAPHVFIPLWHWVWACGAKRTTRVVCVDVFFVFTVKLYSYISHFSILERKKKTTADRDLTEISNKTKHAHPEIQGRRWINDPNFFKLMLVEISMNHCCIVEVMLMQWTADSLLHTTNSILSPKFINERLHSLAKYQWVHKSCPLNQREIPSWLVILEPSHQSNSVSLIRFFSPLIASLFRSKTSENFKPNPWLSGSWRVDPLRSVRC